MIKFSNTYSLSIKCLTLLALSVSLFSQEKIALTGTIHDFAGDPIVGAVITSLGKNVSDTSDAAGSFDIPTSPVVHQISTIDHISRFNIRHNHVYFSLDSEEDIRVELFTIRGRKIQTVFHGMLGRGSFRFPLIPPNASLQMYVVGVRFGNSFFTKKTISLSKKGVVQDHEGPAAGKQKTRAESRPHQNDVFDTLTVTHPGHIDKRVWLYNYTDPVETVLWDTTLRITDDVDGWTDKPEHFATFDTAQLYDLIDGGAPIYNDEGLVDGIYQFLENNDGKSCAISFYNFSTSDKSLAMFTVQKSWVSAGIVIPGYADSIAVGDETIGGAMIYTRFNQFDLEMTLGGYTDVELLKNDAVLFLDVYKAKIGTNTYPLRFSNQE
jgi:hypothetical protein